MTAGCLVRGCWRVRTMATACLLTCQLLAGAQTYSLETVNDSLSYLLLVGVVKTTRFDPVMARRLFIFKNHHGRIRALWMGSRLGGILEDFRFRNGHVVTLQSTTDGRYAVLEHEWRKFGLGALRFLASGVSREEALAAFNSDR